MAWLEAWAYILQEIFWEIPICTEPWHGKLHTGYDWAFCLPRTCRKIWKMEMYVSWVHLEAAGYLIILLAPTSFPMVLLGLAVRGIGHIPNSAGIYAMVADVADYGEWKNGIRNEGLTFSATSFGTKIGTGIGSAVVGWGLALGNYIGGAAYKAQVPLNLLKHSIHIFLSQ